VGPGNYAFKYIVSLLYLFDISLLTRRRIGKGSKLREGFNYSCEAYLAY
jgi:hypothetical protein